MIRQSVWSEIFWNLFCFLSANVSPPLNINLNIAKGPIGKCIYVSLVRGPDQSWRKGHYSKFYSFLYICFVSIEKCRYVACTYEWFIFYLIR
jgi:hypothetical protein